jgi:WD40 repeat protein
MQVMGLVAHPGEISSLSATFDGKYLFTAGGSDLSVNMWSVNCAAVSPPETSKHEEKKDHDDFSNFLCLLEGGEGGELHNDIVDYFFYCQIRAQGEDSMEQRQVAGTLFNYL